MLNEIKILKEVMMLDIKGIEDALGIKLLPEVIEYIQNGNHSFSSGRRTGKTTAYMIRMALRDDCSLNIKDLIRGCHNDEWRDPYYTDWFFREFMTIREQLRVNGFKVIDINGIKE